MPYHRGYASLPLVVAARKPLPVELPSHRLPYKPVAGLRYRNLEFGRWEVHFQYLPARDPSDFLEVVELVRPFSLEKNNRKRVEADEKLYS